MCNKVHQKLTSYDITKHKNNRFIYVLWSCILILQISSTHYNKLTFMKYTGIYMYTVNFHSTSMPETKYYTLFDWQRKPLLLTITATSQRIIMFRTLALYTLKTLSSKIYRYFCLYNFYHDILCFNNCFNKVCVAEKRSIRDLNLKDE